jgi:hypothetical protein
MPYVGATYAIYFQLLLAWVFLMHRKRLTMRVLVTVVLNTGLNLGEVESSAYLATYKKRTTIQFDSDPEIVVIDSFSNGPKDEERLYILDVVQRKDSMFWRREDS